MNNGCRLCRTPLDAPAYRAPAPALTSTQRHLDTATVVYICETCGLAQSPDLPDVKAFYASEYRISLDSVEHDQLVTLGDGRSVFRTDFQADALISMCAPRQGARVLDYGAAKAATLRKLKAARPDILPHVFDVSDDYRGHWAEWVAPANMATHELPTAWRDRFDLVTAHFVLEHVVDPVKVLFDLASLLAPDGQLFLSVPDALANPGDLIVVDHLNHFTRESLEGGLRRAGLQAVTIDADVFPGALITTSVRVAPAEPHFAPSQTGALRAASAAWGKAAALVRNAARTHAGKPAAIYGAGFYGSFVRTLLGEDAGVLCFLDRNQHIQGTTHMGLPVYAPEDVPSNVTVVYAGLNPHKARSIISSVPTLSSREVVWLDSD
jgi:SAM-dependent methyltransferase